MVKYGAADKIMVFIIIIHKQHGPVGATDKKWGFGKRPHGIQGDGRNIVFLQKQRGPFRAMDKRLGFWLNNGNPSMDGQAVGIFGGHHGTSQATKRFRLCLNNASD